MSTKTEPGPFDGMARAEPDEPVFTLRAHDPLAPALVHEWVDRRRKAIREAFAREEISEAKRDLELIQCREAEEIAWSMKDWRTGMTPITPVDENVEKPAAYSGHASSEEELAAKARHDAIKAAGSLLNNAIAGITDAATDHLAPHGFANERAVILAVADRLKAVSSHIAPKRASYYAGQPMPEPFDGAESGNMAELQAGVGKWVVEVFGEVIAMDRLERAMRFLEEAMELVQANGMTEEECRRVAAYVWSRAPGDPFQEVGGVMITLAAYCFRDELDLESAAITEYRRINTPEMRERIFSKQASKRAAGLTSDAGFRADPPRQ